MTEANCASEGVGKLARKSLTGAAGGSVAGAVAAMGIVFTTGPVVAEEVPGMLIAPYETAGVTGAADVDATGCVGVEG